MTPTATIAAPSLLRHRNFMLLFGADTISQLGTQITLVALPLVAILALDAGPFQVGLLFAAQTSAFVLIGLPAGVWVDRMRRRSILIHTDLIRAALLGSIPVAWWLGKLSLLQLYVVALGVSVARVFFDVAYQSYVPTLVDRARLVDGNGKLEIVNSGAQVAGPSVGGWLVNLLSAPVAIVADAVSFVCSALLLGRIDAAEPAPQRARALGLLGEIREGVRFVLGHPILRMIALRSALANMAFSAALAVQALFLLRELGLPPEVYGVLLAAGAIGGLVGGAVVGPLTRRIGSARIIWLGPLLFQPFALLVPFTRPGAGLAFFVAGTFVEAIGIVVYNVSQISFRQAITPERLLGRMNATMRFLVWGTMPLGSLLGGALGERYGVRAALWMGIGGLLLSLLPLLLSPLVRMRDLPTASMEPA
ncbi:MFS transporter [Sorangium cellulosum]|uniref:MFS transporter n=1 Tax=Sorangium cellulosum TaxID=56 RepID=UPI003D9A4E2F